MKRSYLSIQYLRALAALLVVLHHARNKTDWLYNPLFHTDFGLAGVQVFFVISGFVMCVAARAEKPGQFVWRRLIRIVPLYWLATLYVFAHDHEALRTSGATTVPLLKSLGFMPYESLMHPGHFWPVLVAGWTLNYEMFFYALFACGLLLKRPVAFTVCACATLVLAGEYMQPKDPVLSTYTHPLLLDFAAGLLIGVYSGKDGMTGVRWLLLPGLSGLIACACLPDAFWSQAGMGISSVCLVAGALAFEKHRALFHSRSLKLLGDSSYSLYLTHTLLPLGIAGHIWRNIPLTGLPQFAGFAATFFILALVTAVLVHWWVEKPLLKLLRGTAPAPKGV